VGINIDINYLCWSIVVSCDNHFIIIVSLPSLNVDVINLDIKYLFWPFTIIVSLPSLNVDVINLDINYVFIWLYSSCKIVIQFSYNHCTVSD
jgi:hypothetical protein